MAPRGRISRMAPPQAGCGDGNSLHSSVLLSLVAVLLSGPTCYASETMLCRSEPCGGPFSASILLFGGVLDVGRRWLHRGNHHIIGGLRIWAASTPASVQCCFESVARSAFAQFLRFRMPTCVRSLSAAVTAGLNINRLTLHVCVV
jgi:hypothetical protein